MLNKISQSDKEKVDLFRATVASLGPSSGWGLHLASWNKDLNNLLSDTAAAVTCSLPARVYKRRKVISSSSSSTQSSSSFPVVSAAVPVDSTRVASSIAALPPVSSSPIPSAPLFSSFRASMNSSNMFTVSESASLPPLPSDFFSRSQVIQRPSGPRMIMPTSATGVSSSSGGRPKTAFGSRPPTSAPRPRGTASDNGAQSFLEFIRQQFADVHSVMKEHQDLIQLHTREIAYWKRKDELKSKQITHLFSLTKEQGSQLHQLSRKDAVTTAKHENLVKATDQLH
ncbi:hypothetical protein HanRHA438_Chr11g0488981 [Helianthus annuus]|nr:hypothetical protein HanHA300_Chr11g0390101 [Helianthus annuus]KAJ0684367.1 hypothetical protein HanLR1_Chr11g0390431 [Helianthus annuus]KAJ0869421.1 hypothetical protein HanRHA438_Chr11g0488981 [Helianthus annuus]